MLYCVNGRPRKVIIMIISEVRVGRGGLSRFLALSPDD
jgi:hypothetical protein